MNENISTYLPTHNNVLSLTKIFPNFEIFLRLWFQLSSIHKFHSTHLNNSPPQARTEDKTNKQIQTCNLKPSSLSSLKHHPWFVKVIKADCILAPSDSEMLAVFVRICIFPKFCDSLLKCAVAVFPSLAFAFWAREPSPLLRAPCRLLTGTGGIYSVSKNFQTLYLLSSWLPLVSLSPLPPTPSLILSSCVFSFALLRRAGVALADDSVFKTSFLLKRVCSLPFPQLPRPVGARWCSICARCSAANFAVIQWWRTHKNE